MPYYLKINQKFMVDTGFFYFVEPIFFFQSILNKGFFLSKIQNVVLFQFLIITQTPQFSIFECLFGRLKLLQITTNKGKTRNCSLKPR